ncbi:MAG: hypothetical protein COZ07_00675 [Candidatus Infernicultor aquiphilus]|uniref:Uncharacterized protein n=1 Tax=Candidatus Infernicultor aquiphilus TaxID=1805029 RepID=A0A1J5GB13_9BACT|nr:hypothetical protein [bacterium]OIP66818.1 MAG: hypothetical protein AUK42_07775 [Candidatus Atribacteria bacterium CG2_30_33_13]PIU25083.1 MAG: hypothetical protein COT11_04630 [Candidatus Atribacteria bacterium CG08_land_8_20_14_0_20_33_29]PIW11793.1 MAG: hypothetical protein COW35_05010 [Candidatus Atribacteria bacterium CG17_big_fil_post_rev_8_21_14_2_50_34_11]PIX34418.1 MAG: hypothetical protein COZ58_03960 [Candidatus Atribacteria bacterium CG_4_8_14_3_um_filter_34_18]PIY33840.1 MAG: 
MRRIIFIAVLSGLFLMIGGILLLIWWPVKPSLAEITDSWVALIMVYLFLIIFLYEKTIYKFFNEFIITKNLGRHDSQQSRQKQLLFSESISNFNISSLISNYNSNWESILKKESQDTDSKILTEEREAKYIRKLQEENIKWRFLYADSYLVLYAKYVLFWLYKSKLVNREEFDDIWKSKISDSKEREAILNALLDLEFVWEEEDTLSITELGSAYVNYLKEVDKQISEQKQ